MCLPLCEGLDLSLPEGSELSFELETNLFPLIDDFTQTVTSIFVDSGSNHQSVHTAEDEMMTVSGGRSVHIAVGMIYDQGDVALGSDQTTRDSLRLKALQGLLGESGVLYSFSREVSRAQSDRHMSGNIGSLRSVKEQLARLDAEDHIDSIYFDWFRMPEAYALEHMYSKSLFCDIIPWLARTRLRKGAEIWIPGSSGVVDKVAVHIRLLLTFFDITFEFNLDENLLYRASDQVTRAVPLHVALERHGGEDIYLSTSPMHRPKFLRLRRHDITCDDDTLDQQVSNLTVI